MVGFVILHYMAYDMTKTCVYNLLNTQFIDATSKIIESNNLQIVIVDNASPNGTGQLLKDDFKTYENIHIILNDSNEGFAKGNNKGYNYLKENFDLDFIIIMNEDVLIDDSDFIKKIYNIYQRTNFAILGPDIFATKLNNHQNPVYLKGNTKEIVIKLRQNLINQLKHFTISYYLNNIKSKIKMIIKKSFLFSKKKSTIIDWNKEYINPVLHGSCYIFSRNFINNRDYAFYPETFLYYEEDILHMQCLKQNLKMLYSPEIKVRHLQNISTDMIFKKRILKKKMEAEQLIKSMKCFIDLYDL